MPPGQYLKTIPSGSGTIRVDLNARLIFEELVQSTLGFLNQQAANAAQFARERAPVRKVFYGGRRANRLQPSFKHTSAGSAHRHTADFRRIKISRDINTFEETITLSSKRALQELNYKGHLELRRANRATFGRRKLPNVELTDDERDELAEQYARYRADQALPETIRRGVKQPTLSIGTRARGKNISAVYQGRLGGRLRGEIYFIPATARADQLVAEVVSPTPYARFVELGTSRSRKQPYLRPALMYIRSDFREGLKKALSRTGKRR